MTTSKRITNAFPNLTENIVKSIITDPQSAEILVTQASEIGEYLAKAGLSASQIRAIFGEVRRIEGEWKTVPERANRNLILLKPKMAYRAKKERGQVVQTLVDVLTSAINYVEHDQEKFTRFVEFFEAILAYHKANDGKD